MVGTYPPTRCGIGRFGASLAGAVERADPQCVVDVVRLIGHGATPADPARVKVELDPDNLVGIRAAARFLNRCDAVILQHEYGIFGSDDGVAVIELLRQLDTPTVVVMHTVLSNPSDSQRRIVDAIHGSGTMVVLCESARRAMAATFGIPGDEVLVIPHGSELTPRPSNPSPRRRLVSWGLLGPGKGLERAIRSVARIRDGGTDVRYRIVGRTHPEVARREGFAYRRSLERVVAELGLENQVDFVDRYVDDGELSSIVAWADLVIVPYDNQDQVSSGVITEALGVGRPVVSTRFPYASEMLSSGAGVVVDHDSGAMAEAIAGLLEDTEAYEHASERAAEWSARLQWEAVGGEYADLVGNLVERRATA
jgi:glycosyltransferase involved in cell wall biosynthesis